MKKPIQVIKIGGNELSVPGFVQHLAEVIKEQQKRFACILVHGGGRAIDDLMQKMQIEPQYKNGQRITDEKTLEIAEMVLSGMVNKKLVLEFAKADIESIGLSGVDQKLLQVDPWGAEMNLVGRIVKVRTDLLTEYSEKDVVSVISPISLGPDGRYNVNADHAAGMIAGSLKADRVVFISNVPGVMVGSHITPKLSHKDMQLMIESGTITGGMIPKVNAALDALNDGAGQATITDLSGFQNHTGTTIVIERNDND